MAEYTAVAVQTVAAGQNVVFNQTHIAPSRGVYHREGSGIVGLRGITGGQCRARYRVAFNGNLAVPTGGTVGPVSIAIAIAGEALPYATAIVTPAAVEEFFNVHADTFVDVPCGCCANVSVENVGTDPILVQNGNLIVEREC